MLLLPVLPLENAYVDAVKQAKLVKSIADKGKIIERCRMCL